MTDIDPQSSENNVPFYPDHVSKETKVVVGFSVLVLLVGLIGLFAPVGLGDPADPMNTPAHVKPEWYFLGLYQLLKYISKTAGAVLPIFAILVITLWPFIDRKPDKSSEAYRWRAISVAIFMIFLIAMTIWGEVS
jgi:quinol-cytochrome oxidoreductase complex cytochrome b subunit